MSRRLLPNSTQIPDLILDEWMPLLSGAELKVALFIARKTYGWGKAADALALSQIAEGTGLGRRTVNEALHGTDRREGLIALGMVIHIPSDLPVGHPKAWATFSLNLDADSAESTHAESAQVHDSNPCEKRTGKADQPVRKMSETHAESAQVHDSNPCEKRTQQETKKHYRQETAAAHAPAYVRVPTRSREEVPSSAAAAAASLPASGEENNPTVPGSSGQIITRVIIPTVPAGFPADAVPPPAPVPVAASTSANVTIVTAGLTLDAFEPMPWGKGYDAFRAAFPADAEDFDREIADRAGTDRAIRKPPEVYFRQRIIETLRGERSSVASNDRVSAVPSVAGAPASIPISTSLAQILALQRADRERQAAATVAASSAPEGARPQ